MESSSRQPGRGPLDAEFSPRPAQAHAAVTWVGFSQRAMIRCLFFACSVPIVPNLHGGWHRLRPLGGTARAGRTGFGAPVVNKAGEARARRAAVAGGFDVRRVHGPAKVGVERRGRRCAPRATARATMRRKHEKAKRDQSG